MYTGRVFFKSTKKSKLKVLRKVNSIFGSTYVPFRILVSFRNCQEKFADYRALRVQRVLFTNVLANNNIPRPEHTLQLVNTCNAFYVWIEHIDHSFLVFFNCIFYITDVLMYFFYPYLYILSKPTFLSASKSWSWSQYNSIMYKDTYF